MSGPLCTLVSAYYRFRSKHGADRYGEWIRNFLGTVETPLVMFCDADTEPLIREARGSLPMHLVQLPIAAWETSAPRFEAYWERDIARDPERAIHSTPLYKVWAEKAFFVQRAIRANPFGTDWFVWVDAGCFRDPRPEVLATLRQWPRAGAWGTLPADRITMLLMYPFQPQDYVLSRDSLLPREYAYTLEMRIGGTILAGSVAGWARWNVVWRGMLEAYMHAGYFTGKDQNLMATVATMFPDLVHLVPSSPARRDPWFYFHELFSG